MVPVVDWEEQIRMSQTSIGSDSAESTPFETALVYAARFHAKQLRKGTRVPYIAHPLAVASTVLEHGGTQNEAIAALLHDVIEDGGGKGARLQIRQLFGDEVAAIVEGCTETDEVPKPPWRPRKEAYTAHLPSQPPSVLLVSAADKLDNARSVLADYRVLGESLWSRFNGGRETLWYYRTITNALIATQQHQRLVKELDGVVSELERLASV